MFFIKDRAGGFFSTSLFKASYLEEEDFLRVILAYHILVIAAAFAFIAFVFTALKILENVRTKFNGSALERGKNKLIKRDILSYLGIEENDPLLLVLEKIEKSLKGNIEE